ncbi:MAG: hypothetical protein GIW95_00130 [Candidatus Eremiobacteraeota bacterium]|nr:hypothetical protein [Candidatus Eremiobacteraeota bacterium]
MTLTRGPAWENSQSLRTQVEWNEHAAFMDDLVASGFVALGGPIKDASDALLIESAEDGTAIRATLAPDPPHRSGVLEVPRIRRWTLLLDSQSTRS